MVPLNVPNVLTVVRIMLVPVLVVALLEKTGSGDLLVRARLEAKAQEGLRSAPGGDEPYSDLLPLSERELPRGAGTLPPPFRRERLFEDVRSSEGDEPRQPRPKLVFPCNPVSRQLPALLSQVGMESLLESWRSRERPEGIMRDIMDGEVWKRLPDPQGKPFFDNREERAFKDELRIGVTLSMDG